MNLVDVATEIAERLGTILNGRATPFAPDKVVVPAGYVFGPDTTYDSTYGRGMDAVTLSVTIAVARVPLEQAWRSISAYISGSGERSVKAVLEADEGEYESFDSITVTRSQVTDAPIAGLDCKCAVFDIDIVGSGS